MSVDKSALLLVKDFTALRMNFLFWIERKTLFLIERMTSLSSAVNYEPALPVWRGRSPQVVLLLTLMGFLLREISILSLLVFVSIETNRLREIEGLVKRKVFF